ncbi:PQQ-dependent sugar dehydrogenase [Spirosoma rhododendri]|uniref:PQQ-dependent sugar dehydrogenase n=1 Tax=Spirosoma rhododendri TaxID=2728024 RepID=A0A7L5DGK8_9BACT|nr:PQQ-dependent sugar dehydrogenase [Spirosoma rhododendri]QJD77065.1 PQQ-dependent sugar dehydrogenase [Spirosoma rhododendri]
MKTHNRFALSALLAGASLLSSCQQTTESNADAVPAPAGIQVSTVLTGYEIIWGMDFLPNNELIFTEKRGKLYRLPNGATTATEITGLPTNIYTTNQGGLLDVRVHPQYASNGWIYASHAASTAGTQAGRLNLIRFKLTNNQVSNLETIFQTDASNTWQGHYGSRIEFGPDNMLYLSVGEGGPRSQGGTNSPNQNAQNTQLGWGKIHRMTDSGQVPFDNPILPGNTAPTTIYAYGNRNPQGLAINPKTNQLWETEHGPQGGDEVNIIQKGANYGWPLVSYGINYDGTTISQSPTRDGIQAPVHTWTPSIGTSGLAFITNERFGSANGGLATGALAGNYLSILSISNNQITGEAKLLEGQGRIRNVKQGPDGNLYVSLESPGRILRLAPR